MNRDIRICFIGDSFVNGTGDETKLGWAGRLCTQLEAPDKEITYYNLGIRRNTSKDIKARWEYECGTRLIDGAENIVFFSFGVNDTVLDGLNCRISKLESIENAKSILTDSSKKYNVRMIGPTPVIDIEQNNRIRALDFEFMKIAEDLDIPYLSVFESLLCNQTWMEESSNNDGFHPQSGGYQILGELIINWEKLDI